MTDVVACVTGAARGIGAATATHLAQQGATVFVAGRNAAACAVTADAITDAASAVGGRALPLVLDVTDAASIADAFRTIFTTTRRLDVLVNNAGVMPSMLLGTMDAAGIESVLATNTTGAILCMQGALRLMQRHRRGAIVNVSSVLAAHGVVGRTAYAASKAALEAATRAAAVECAPWGVRVNAVAPGWIDTELVADFDDVQRDALRARVPMGRAGQAAEVASAIAFLASDAAAYVTGAVLPVDGGYVP